MAPGGPFEEIKKEWVPTWWFIIRNIFYIYTTVVYRRASFASTHERALNST